MIFSQCAVVVWHDGCGASPRTQRYTRLVFVVVVVVLVVHDSIHTAL